MGSTTSGSADGGNPSSRRAKSPVGGAGSRSSRGRRGISGTTTSTGPDTGDQSTEGATAGPQPTPPNAGVADAVRRDLEVVAKADPALASSALAALALALAGQIDDPDNSATSKSMCAGQLRDTLDRVRELMPKAAEKDGLDDLSKRRADRLAARKSAAKA